MIESSTRKTACRESCGRCDRSDGRFGEWTHEGSRKAFFVSNGCRRRTVTKPEGYFCIRLSGLFANTGGTAEIFVFVLL